MAPKRPSGPSVPLSEPEREQRIAESVNQEIENGEFDGVKICLTYAREYLREHGLDVDSEGFVIHRDTEEYAVPYVFVERLVKEKVMSEEESVFEAFFRPCTDEVRAFDYQRLHLTDLHAVVPTENGYNPVRDDGFNLASFHARLETGFSPIMAWSDLVKKDKIDKEGRWLSLGMESDSTLELNCFNPDCGFSGPLSSWNGDEYAEPECPECGGLWDFDRITVCTICGVWYWGSYYEGKSVYAEPVCANCGEDMEHLEIVTQYNNIDSLEGLVEAERPQFTVYGLNSEGDVVYTFNHADTREDAEDEKRLAEKSSSMFKNIDIESVVIRERDEIQEVSQHTRNDEQAR